jgi:hypothetical protein
MLTNPRFFVSGNLLACCLIFPSFSTAQEAVAVVEKKPPVKVELAEGTLVLPAPAEWEQQKPRNRLIELEFLVPAKEEATPEAADSKAAEGKPAAPGRFTVMQSGGTIRANLIRWVGQFKDPQAPEGSEVGQAKKLDIDGMPAHLIDLSGTFIDSPRGPFGPKVERENYRMLAAILETKDSGNYFFKLVGPEELIKEQAEAFVEMLKGIQRKAEATEAKPEQVER